MRRLVLLTLIAGGLLALPSTAGAATCSAYSTQAAAQRAADTRDADSDGIYCEALPCPCSKGGTAKPAPPRTPVRRSCSRGTTRGVINGVVKCLRSGEFCVRSRNAAYRRYHYRCATASDGRARLRRI